MSTVNVTSQDILYISESTHGIYAISAQHSVQYFNLLWLCGLIKVKAYLLKIAEY